MGVLKLKDIIGCRVERAWMGLFKRWVLRAFAIQMSREGASTVCQERSCRSLTVLTNKLDCLWAVWSAGELLVALIMTSSGLRLLLVLQLWSVIFRLVVGSFGEHRQTTTLHICPRIGLFSNWSMLQVLIVVPVNDKTCLSLYHFSAFLYTGYRFLSDDANIILYFVWLWHCNCNDVIMWQEVLSNCSYHQIVSLGSFFLVSFCLLLHVQLKLSMQSCRTLL